jgi:hypothetical protein
MCAVTGRMNPNKIDQLVFDNLLGLCDDTDMDVRKNMCISLTATSLSLGLKLTKKYLFEEYNILLKDEEVAVQEAALVGVMDICQMFDSETKINFLIPLWKNICEESNPRLIDTVLHLFGPFMYCVKEELNSSDRQFFVTYFQTNVATSDIVCMRTCLFNFPVPIFNKSIIASLNPQNFEKFQLDKTLSLFETEDDFDIQKTLALQFHEVVFVNVALYTVGSKRLSFP